MKLKGLEGSKANKLDYLKLFNKVKNVLIPDESIENPNFPLLLGLGLRVLEDELY